PLHAPMSTRDGKLEYQLIDRFWFTCKKLFNSSVSALPKFSLSVCESYFNNILTDVLGFTSFNLPSWIPSLPTPLVPFNDTMPTYQEIVKIIRKIKSSS